MTVYLLERDVYEDRRPAGVYASLDDAQAAGGGTWKQVSDDYWINDRDWREAAEITAFELIEPER